MRRHAQGIKTAVKGLQLGCRQHLSADAGGCAMFDVDVRADIQLAFLAKGMERMKCRDLHQADHVGSGVDGRQLLMVRGKCVLEFDGLPGFAAGAYGSRFCHAEKLNQPGRVRNVGLAQVKF
jgi:hypothetical protein